MSRPEGPRALIIGVSGATWDVLAPLVHSGRAPNIARLMQQGASATLASVKAPDDEHYRPQVAWVSLATGCRPERHGVTKFFHEAGELREPTLWNIYSQFSLSSGVYGWPGTWPPPHIPGFVVPSHLGRDVQTWPASLNDIKALDREQQSLERDGRSIDRLRSAGAAVRTLVKYGVRPRTLAESARIGAGIPFGDPELSRLLLRKAKLEISVDVFLELCRKFRPALAAFVTFYVDFVSHRYWRYRDPSLFDDNDPRSQRRYASAVEDSYLALDRVVGRLRAAAGEGAVIALVSEHGMNPEPSSAEMGRWYYSIQGARVRELAGLPASIEPRPVARWFAFRPLAAADRRRVAEALLGITVAETGLPLFRVYEHEDEVVIKFRLDGDTPRYAQGDLESLTIRIGDNVVPFNEVARRSGSRRSAMHAQDGVMVLAGPGIRRGAWLDEASVLDVAPTLLQATRVRTDARFDGRVLDVFD